MSTREVTREELHLSQAFGWTAHRAGGEDYLWTRALGDGRAVFLLPKAPEADLAWKAALGWDGEGEPEGWYRHPQTGRRRPGGDPAQEHVYW